MYLFAEFYWLKLGYLYIFVNLFVNKLKMKSENSPKGLKSIRSIYMPKKLSKPKFESIYKPKAAYKPRRNVRKKFLGKMEESKDYVADSSLYSENNPKKVNVINMSDYL